MLQRQNTAFFFALSYLMQHCWLALHTALECVLPGGQGAARTLQLKMVTRDPGPLAQAAAKALQQRAWERSSHGNAGSGGQLPGGRHAVSGICFVKASGLPECLQQY